MADELSELIKERSDVREQMETLSIQMAPIKKAHDELGGRMSELGEKMARFVEETGLRPEPVAPKKRAKPKPRKPNHEAVAKRYADREPIEAGCLCGCGEEVDAATNFVKGHHRVLRSIAMAVEAGTLDSHKISNRGYEFAVSEKWIDRGEAAE